MQPQSALNGLVCLSPSFRTLVLRCTALPLRQAGYQECCHALVQAVNVLLAENGVSLHLQRRVMDHVQRPWPGLLTLQAQAHQQQLTVQGAQAHQLLHHDMLGGGSAAGPLTAVQYH